MLERKIRTIAWISFVIFFLLMLPVVYLTFVNRATGDDYGYAVYTRSVWMATYSLTELSKAICHTVRDFYSGWQGTWFSIAIFSLQPEVFHDDAYTIVAVLMLFLWIGSTFYLFCQILCREIGLGKWSYLLVTVWFLITSIEFIPSTRSSIFWFNGCAHYMIPFAMCQMVTAWMFKFRQKYTWNYLVGILVFMTLLGGSNYQAALLALVVAFYIVSTTWILKNDKRIFRLCIPIFTELCGLFVSGMSEGNKVRAGEEFGFSFEKAVKTIGLSFQYAIKDIGVYMKERPLIFAGLLFLFLLLIRVFYAQAEVARIKHPAWLAAMLFCLYSAMQAPAIYAGVPVSGGVPNTNFQVFMLMASGCLMIISLIIVGRLRKWLGEEMSWKVLRIVIAAGMGLCIFLGIICRSNIKDSTSYVSLDYILSGQAKDYKEQMDLQTEIMEDESREDVVVPQINDVQGPLMHMPVTDQKDAWTNTVTSRFYGKQSVIAIDRNEWMRMYGE